MKRSGDRSENVGVGNSCTPTPFEVLNQIPTPVILSEQESRAAGLRRVEGSRGCVTNKGRVREFSRERLYTVS